MVPIRYDQITINLATSQFPSQVVDFPIKYMGIALSMGKLPKLVWQPLVDKAIDRLPVWKGNMMNRSGRLALIRSSLSSIPIYVSISIRQPGWVHNALIKIMKAILWTGSDVVQGGKCLIA
jgi:hypothetical protein